MKKTLAILAAAAALTASAQAAGRIQITEWTYTGLFGEFVEVTNTGDANVDVHGFRYRDSGGNYANGVPIAAATGTDNLAAGQCIIITEISQFIYELVWFTQPVKTEPSNLRFVENVTVNLGRGDAIRIFNAAGTVVNSVTYDDDAGNGPRTEDVSGVALGALSALPDLSQGTDWKLSNKPGAADPAAWKAAVSTANGPIGSPGYFTR